jgi:hypothetical protein
MQTSDNQHVYILSTDDVGCPKIKLQVFRRTPERDVEDMMIPEC